VGKVLNRHKVGKHFDLEIGDASFGYTINEARVAQEASLDGIYVIRTAVPRERMDSDDVVRNYKNLSQVEQAFRSMKSVDLEVRPIYHRLADRVRAHLLLCMLAYYVKWHMMQAWRPLLFRDEEQAARRNAIRSLRPGARPAHCAKSRTGRWRMAPALHSFDSLLHSSAPSCAMPAIIQACPRTKPPLPSIRHPMPNSCKPRAAETVAV